MQNNNLSTLAARDILSQAVSTNLLPLNLLASDRELSTETLERTLRHANKSLVQFLLVIALEGCDARDDGLGGYRGNGGADWLGGVQGYVAVFVVVDVDVDLAGDGCG